MQLVVRPTPFKYFYTINFSTKKKKKKKKRENNIIQVGFKSARLQL